MYQYGAAYHFLSLKGMNIKLVMNKLAEQAENSTKIGKRKIVLAAWCKHPLTYPRGTHVFNAEDLLAVVRN